MGINKIIFSMKTFALASVAAAAAATKVHPFFAENNYICQLCITVVDYTKEGKDEKVDQIYDQFPALMDRINAFYPQRDEIVNLNDPQGTCVKMELCEDPDIFELLMEEQPVDLSAHIEHVNNSSANWVAGVNSKFEGASLKEIKSIMGTVVDEDWSISLPEKREYAVTDFTAPDSFDARTQWPECESVINHVRDQSNCGSCWAHGTTEALNDRACIASGGSVTELYSVSDTTACCGFLSCQSMGCNGGQVGTPWNWFESKGVVTGGDFGDGKMCYDYTMEKCAHHVESTTLKSCDDVKQVAPTCESSCPSNSSIDYSGDKKHASSSYAVRTVDKIKEEISTKGTVTAAFTVYEDFLTYKSGVYRHTTGNALGGHAIKLIGYGTENGDDYWLAVNSWNDTWGDKGTFKILQGDCGINRQVHAGEASV